MSLLTRCPRCTTLFRVTPTQLEARGGKVRCGRCMNVFDAFQALTVGEAVPAGEEVRLEREAPASGEKVPASAPQDLAAAVTEASAVSEPLLAAADATLVSADNSAASGAPFASEVPKLASTSRSAAFEERLASHHAKVASAAVAAPETPRERMRARLEQWREHSRALLPALRRLSPVARWSIGSAVAALLLLLQLGYAWRGDLAARNAAFRSIFSNLCEHAGCEVPFPRSVEVIKIEASDVHMLDTNRPQLIQLTATLRSYAGYYVAYPALDLVLTNANEHALARRVFAPQEYLDRKRDPNAGFAPNAEITIALDLDTGTLNAAGFRLGLLAAP